MSGLKRHFLPNFSFQRQTSKPNETGDCTDGRTPTTSLLDSGSSGDVATDNLDKITFINDICNCLEFCSAYIQALNTLCSTGSVLAQSLIHVFSRDVSGFLNNGPSNKNSQSNLTQNNYQNSHFFCSSEAEKYYKISEEFLGIWESISVATAGASATVKTETLMNLQDVITKLETNNSDTEESKSDKQQNLVECIQAARACLLSYVELQTQFSMYSWNSLSQISQILNSDSRMFEGFNDIKKHFSPNNQNNLPFINKIPTTSSMQQHPATNLITQHSSQQSIAASWSSFDSNGCGGSSVSENSEFCGLEDAINLLSLQPNGQSQRFMPSKSHDDEPENQVKMNNLAFDEASWAINQEALSQFPALKDWPAFWLSCDFSVDNMAEQLNTWNSFTINEQDSNSGSGESDDNLASYCGNIKNTPFFNRFGGKQSKCGSQSTPAVKRLSCSSDNINLDAALNLASATVMNMRMNYPANMPLDVRVAKTSTWPLKQTPDYTEFSDLISSPERDYNMLNTSPSHTAHIASHELSPMWQFQGGDQENSYPYFDCTDNC